MYKLTDALEAHFLELPKLRHDEIKKDENDVMIQWLEFINAKSKEVMQMLAEKNKDIEKAYKKLNIISQDEQARAAYLAREMAIHDQATREACARKAGIREGIKEGLERGRQEKLDLVIKLLELGVDVNKISEASGLPIEEIERMK